MSSPHRILDELAGHLEESMGVRKSDLRSALAPSPRSMDLGRRPLRSVGKILIDKVAPDPSQPRVEFAENALERLALSIRDKGQLSPIRVRWSESLGKWIIVSGERRWRAAQRAGLTEIDCTFHEAELTQSEILEQQLIENCLREFLQPIEEARGFAALIEFNGWTAKQVAEALRVHPSRVSRALALLRLPESVQAQVNRGEVPARSAYEISKIDDSQMQMSFAQKAASGEMSLEEAAQAVRQRRRKTASRSTKQTFFADDGWKVVVTSPKRGTYLEIEYALTVALAEVRHRIDSGCQFF